MNRMIPALLVTTLLSGWAASEAQTVSRRPHEPLSDREVQSLVEHVLAQMDILDVQVDVHAGVVTLRGVVPNLWAKDEAAQLARDVHDVQSVVNQLVEAPGPAADSQIASELSKRIGQYVFYTIYDDVESSVRGGAVQLQGRVTAPYKAREIEDLVKRVPGVREVRNDIRTLPASPSDDELRASVATRIYRDPTFSSYAIQPNPPIHIIVENGRVTLVGVVGWEVDRREAEQIASSTFGVLSVTNQLRVES